MPDIRYMVDLRNDYVYLLNWLTRTGASVESRGLATREHTGVTLVFRPTPACMLPIGVNRGVNTKLAALEALQLIAGEARSDLVRLAAPRFEDVLVSPDNPDYGAYGPRLSERLSHVYALLRREPDTRRAVATIWEPRDLMHDGDRPCTLTLQFLIRQDALELHVNMRSQDAWLGLTYDAFMFTQIQRTLARRLGVDVGQYVHHVGSFHVYETDVPRVEQLQTCAASYPRLPDGVVASRDATATRVAQQLLANTASDEERRLNPWYQAQIEKLYGDSHVRIERNA